MKCLHFKIFFTTEYFTKILCEALNKTVIHLSASFIVGSLQAAICKVKPPTLWIVISYIFLSFEHKSLLKSIHVLYRLFRP